ncbi:MAG: transglutaminase domain-containing protein [Bacteroidetes bacterium]|nr:transglutaminase domain-containing protein [Bacteroidota bacterium]MCW5895474.1 transglutaminase domain-containing protein [Bacteroidota bacterium]
MTLSNTYGQSLFGARATALGAYAPFVTDTRGFVSNPAGLVGLRDWEFTTSTYIARSDNGFVFHGLALGKRFLDDFAIGVQYSPGSLLEFLVPSGLSINTGDSVVSLDKRVAYSEDLAIGLAYRFDEDFSAGIGGRVRREKVSDTQYKLIPKVEIATTEYSNRTFLADVSVSWKPTPFFTITGMAKNLLAVGSSSLPDDLSEFEMPADRTFEFGMKVDAGSGITAAGVGSTNESGMAGFEFRLPYSIALRSSIYFDKNESPFAYAYGVGAGWRYGLLEVDAAFLGFVNPDRHSGTFAAADFNASRITNLDLNAYTRNKLVLSLKAVFGNVRESLLRIQGVEILSGVYPSSYELFAFRPIGRVRVRNISDKTVQAKASIFVERFMDAATESEAVELLPGEEKEIPFQAVLNDQVRSVAKLTVREANVYVSTAAGEQYDDRVQTRLLIHARNDWDGDVHSLRYFVTPDDPDILRYTRDVLLQYRDSLAAVPRELEPLVKARILFNEFAGKLVYVGDPKQSNDYVQYPSETLVMKSGDCDDMTACFASLLSSVGISTAFVDVVPPQNPEKSHIYMMFDTGLDPKFGSSVSENPKRYVIRKNRHGNKTIWLPIETTVVAKGFESAWSLGAQQYLEDVEINLGLIKGWVKIVDVN